MGGSPTWRGVPVCDCMVPLLDDLAAGTPDLPTIDPSQGCWSTAVAASSQTHAGGGVIDFAIADWTVAQRQTFLVECRRRGLATWERTPAQGFILHHHGVMPGCPHLSGLAKPVVGTAAWQVSEYRAGRNGLAGRGADDGPDGYRNVTWWTYSQAAKDRPQEDYDMIRTLNITAAPGVKPTAQAGVIANGGAVYTDGAELYAVQRVLSAPDGDTILQAEWDLCQRWFARSRGGLGADQIAATLHVALAGDLTVAALAQAVRALPAATVAALRDALA